MERNIKQSRFLDIESLCIRGGEKVWQIRVDLNVLNHDGNILDCANVAVICAMAHFRLPEVSVIGDEIKIVINYFRLFSYLILKAFDSIFLHKHSSEERNPIPLSILHIPLTTTYAFYDQG